MYRELCHLVLRGTIGDLEIDTPPFDEKKSDFAVVLRQDGEYVSLLSPPYEGFDIFSDLPLNLPNKSMIEVSVVFGMLSSVDQELQQIKVKLEPMEVFVDRHLIEDVVPVLMEIFSVVDERSPEISSLIASLPATEQFVGQGSTGGNAGARHGESTRSFRSEPSKGTMREFIEAAPLCAGPNPSMMLKKSVIITLRHDLDKIHEEIRENRKYHDIRNVRLSVIEEPVRKTESEHIQESNNELALGQKTTGELVMDKDETGLSVTKSEVSNGETRRNRELILDVEESEVIEDNVCGFASRQPWTFLHSPTDVDNMLQEFADPFKLQRIEISPVKIYGSVRFKYGMYLAFDRAPVDIKEFVANSVVTTHYGMGHVVGKHYWQSIIFGYKNMISGVGSWEGVGSPTRLVGEVSTGLKDLVVYPYQGIFKGPTGFLVGIGKGCSSMVKHVAAGTLNSVTNGAWTWSRNLDALTQDDEDRRADVHGVADGLAQGFASLGVRMLGK